MSNKRISELVEIHANELSMDDLLLLFDVSSHNTSKLKIEDLNSYIFTNTNSGSLYGTSSWANSSSYAMNFPIPKQVESSSFSDFSLYSKNATNADTASSASYTKSGSYSITSSYALTSSTQLAFSAAFASHAKSASYLTYIGNPNGTASYALTSFKTSGTASHALTSSFTDGTSSYSPTSSYSYYAVYAENIIGDLPTPAEALKATLADHALQATFATQSATSSYLNYTGAPNGTASYAMVVKQGTPTYYNHGIYLSHTHSKYGTQLDKVLVHSPYDTNLNTGIEVAGTVIIPCSSSNYFTCSIELIALNKWSGISYSLDTSPLEASLWINEDSGTISTPFSLMGEVPLSGTFMVYVTASDGAIIHPDRTGRFKISSYASEIEVMSDITMSLRVVSEDETHITFPYTASNILITGTDADCYDIKDTVTEISLNNLPVKYVQYAWLMPALNIFKAEGNLFLEDIGGMPQSLISMSVPFCNLGNLAPLPQSLEYLDCNSNIKLKKLSTIPESLIYLNISNCTFTKEFIEQITIKLVGAGLNNGYINMSGNGVSYTGVTIMNVSILQSRGWTCIT